MAQHYEKEEQHAERQSTAQTIKNELGGSIEDISKIEGILLLTQKEAEKKQKLLYIAFDLAMLRAHLDDKFPRFVYHAGVFESLDDRKKVTLPTIIRRYIELSLQPIITLIDSDLLMCVDVEVFAPEEIVVRLHDEGEPGRL